MCLLVCFNIGETCQKFNTPFEDAIYKELIAEYRRVASQMDWRTANSREIEKAYAISNKGMERLSFLYDSLGKIDPVHNLLRCSFERVLNGGAKYKIMQINKLDKKLYANEIAYWNNVYKKQNSPKAAEAKLAKGKTFYDFKLKTKEGKTVHLKEVLAKNKLILVEFWASWCSPCRKEIPYLKKDYKAFHDKGFEIISISVDKKEAQWLKALGAEEMEWLNVHDTEKFAEKGIPANWMLNSEGKVVAKNLRGHHVEELLKDNL